MTAAQTRILLVLGALVAAVALATALVFSLGSRSGTGGSATGGARAAVTPSRTAAGAPAAGTPRATPSVAVTRPPTPRGGVSVRATSATNVRSGPAVAFPVVTALQPGDEARATGRNADASWLEITTAAGDGWVAAGVVEVQGDPFVLPFVEPAGSATAAATRTPRPGAATSTPTPAGGARATASAGLPDLALQSVSVGPANYLTVVIGNVGPGPLTAQRVGVVGLDDNGAVVFGEITAALTIPAGGAANVELSYRPDARRTLTVVLNPDGLIKEAGTANNRLRVTIAPR